MSQNNQNKVKPSNKEASSKSIKERQKITVFKEVDELGLDPYEFRVYGHIARRGDCFASLEKIAAICCMSVRRVQYSLKVLEEAGLIHKEKRKGRANKFALTYPSKWLNKISKEQLERIRQKVKSHRKEDDDAASTKAGNKIKEELDG
ncbi:MAG: helix-turn-helix domain-containing protein [Cyanosarcina radialis HA8281-LM2]|nr:helix-turn-helix domain-containing protein [Cyanosarcina radialis HA8281-LM2]